MSALWHDADYVPEQRFETPLVQRRLEDMALPTEQHQLPDGVADPFAKLDAVFEEAALQMERGIKGAEFLHGKKATIETTPSRGVERPQESVHAATQPAAIDQRRETQRLRGLDEAAHNAVPKPQGASKTAAEKEAEKVANVGDAVGMAATFVPAAAGQAVQAAAQGPLPALASQAVTMASAVAAAGQVAATGVAEGLKEDEPVQTFTPRRGLKR
jgi:hypothetical protein